MHISFVKLRYRIVVKNTSVNSIIFLKHVTKLRYLESNNGLRYFNYYLFKFSKVYYMHESVH